MPIDPNDHLTMQENPFSSQNLQLPFAGRETALARLHQHLNDPQHLHALVFIGQRYSGKTALLKQFSSVFDELYLGVYLVLDNTILSDEKTWLYSLYNAAREVLLDARLSKERVLEIPHDVENLREWLTETAMPRILQGLRGGRQLVFLLDDADALIAALDEKRLPDDSPAFLQSLLNPKLDIVLTVDTDVEDQLHRLTPLVNPTDAVRLNYLERDELAQLYTGPDMEVVNQVATRVYRLIGGHPALAQRMGDLLWQRTGSRLIKLEDVQAVIPQIYAESAGYYRELWQELTLNERLVLTALSGLLYDDPLKSVMPEQIEAWIVETDYRIDMTAIHAAIRGLEYREIIHHENGGVVITAELLQKWLLENARLESTPTISTRSEIYSPLPKPQQHRALWIAIGAAVILFTIIILAVVLNSTPTASGMEGIPTVTLPSNATP